MMNSAADQILFEALVGSLVPLAILTPWGEPIGAGTEASGLRAMQFWHGLLAGVGVKSSPPAIIHAEAGPVVLLAVDDEGKSLAEIWSALSRWGIEESSWVAKWDGSTWRDLFPTRGVPRVLPAEITLLPARIYQLEAELKELRARQDELTAKNTERMQFLKSGLVTDALAQDDGAAAAAQIEERLEAVRAELAAWGRTLTGGQS